VAAASNRDEKSLLSREANGGDDVRDSGAACNQRRAPVDRGVPDLPPVVIVGIGGADELSAK
jgi:hypothetical protein